MTGDHGEALAAALAQDAHALELAPTAHQIDTLIGYIGLLERWNSVYNLTAIRDPGAMLTQHVVDCLATIRPLQRATMGRRINVLDVGSGGGLPGLVIATMLEHTQVTCVDTVGKKAAFVQQAAGELGLKNLRSLHARVERIGPASFDAICCRAFASLRTVVQLTERLLKPDGVWMAMKGQVPSQEIAEVGATADVFHVEPLSVPRLAADRCLVWMRRHAEVNPLPTL